MQERRGKMKDTRTFTNQEIAEYKNLVKCYKGKVDYERFNQCNAYISDLILSNLNSFRLIKSYNTIVAVINIETGEYIEFGKYSRTTSKQVSQIYNTYYRNFKRHYYDTCIDEY